MIFEGGRVLGIEGGGRGENVSMREVTQSSLLRVRHEDFIDGSKGF